MGSKRLQEILDPFDQRQIAVARRGVEGTEAVENLANAGKGCHVRRVKHRAEKWKPVFRKSDAQDNELERARSGHGQSRRKA
jgi:hypothetical protein